MLGPVFGVELLRAGRRGRAHVLRWLFAGWLVLQFLYLYSAYDEALHAARARPVAVANTTEFARGFLDIALTQQFLLIALVAPAFAAGAVTDEKTHGTLQNLLTAHLTPAAIVLGKLFARAVQVGVLGLVPLPLITLVGPYAGVTPEFLLIGLAVTALLVFGLSAASVLASVWTRQTRNAVLLTYLAFGGLYWLTAFGPAVLTQYVPPGWLEAFDPLRPLAPALDRADPAEAFRRLGAFAAAWGGLGAACAAVAVWRLRPAYLRQMEARPRRWYGLARLVPRPSPGRDALAWKESQVGRRVPYWLGLPLAAGASAWATAGLCAFSPAPRGLRGEALISLGWWVLLLLTLVVGVRASGSITGERERQTWDGLLTTPLATRELVRGKLRGILDGAWTYLITYSLASAATVAVLYADDPHLTFLLLAIGAGLAGLIVWVNPRAVRYAAVALALSAALLAGPVAFVITALGLVVTGLSMYFLGAVGLYCSARSHSSWRSLLATVAIGYVGGFVLFCVSTPLACISSIVLGLVATLLQELFVNGSNLGGPPFWVTWDRLLPVFWAVGTAVAYWWAARSLLDGAEKHVAKYDRIPTGRLRLIDLDLPMRYSRRVHRRAPSESPVARPAQRRSQDYKPDGP
jgi:ABC-type transport system involved in multi-copper enzyme maturation permease subunit